LKDAIYSGGAGAHFLFYGDLSFLKRRLLIWFEKSELSQIIQRVLPYKLIGLQRDIPVLMPDKPVGNKCDTFWWVWIILSVGMWCLVMCRRFGVTCSIGIKKMGCNSFLRNTSNILPHCTTAHRGRPICFMMFNILI
jgi:hypothetical protein